VSLRPSLPSIPGEDTTGDQTADRARGLLEQLKSSGFMATTPGPLSPNPPATPRRRRLKAGSMAAELAAELDAIGSPIGSPLASPDPEAHTLDVLQMGSSGGVAHDTES
jgi:cytokinesis protein